MSLIVSVISAWVLSFLLSKAFKVRPGLITIIVFAALISFGAAILHIYLLTDMGKVVSSDKIIRYVQYAFLTLVLSFYVVYQTFKSVDQKSQSITSAETNNGNYKERSMAFSLSAFLKDKLILIVMLFAVVVMLVFNQLEIGNYEECVLEKMKGQSKNMARFAQIACRKKYPEACEKWQKEQNRYVEIKNNCNLTDITSIKRNDKDYKPKKCDVVDGYVFLGGDPGNEWSWMKIINDKNLSKPYGCDEVLNL